VPGEVQEVQLGVRHIVVLVCSTVAQQACHVQAVGNGWSMLTMHNCATCSAAELGRCRWSYQQVAVLVGVQ
jgi:hypothetical protein